MADQREYLPPTHCLIQINHSINPYHYEYFYVLIDFSLTVKAATLIFISGRGSSAKQGKSGSIYNLVKN